ncbi:hypothetical protein HZF08_15730 [Paenibacillus sp. CGMCC 1.16610]|uniref:Uncharacterized protein n=1 Tax=Paenibacillus anseongense TaxID=2682845 RepID=A0ABW9UHS1_9BACL|nr:MULTISPECIES: hypothetical protein [Paenibacillus]MBA2939763.1 hypothetical protein [Paenibacillus sp. CGMCC 1.16610]MVQ39423.1 hypothetical protein [Paenibacillus anseongense]
MSLVRVTIEYNGGVNTYECNAFIGTSIKRKAETQAETPEVETIKAGIIEGTDMAIVVMSSIVGAQFALANDSNLTPLQQQAMLLKAIQNGLDIEKTVQGFQKNTTAH